VNDEHRQEIRGDALRLAEALRLVCDAYIYPHQYPNPERLSEARMEAAFRAGSALGSHGRLRHLYTNNELTDDYLLGG
jgi:hypothetical protein